jgi:hypothetical protein
MWSIIRFAGIPIKRQQCAPTVCHPRAVAGNLGAVRAGQSGSTPCQRKGACDEGREMNVQS